MANSGCGPTSMAMVVNYYDEENTITPDIIADYAMVNGYRTANQGTSWSLFSAIANEYDLEFIQTYSAEEAKQWMMEHNNALIIGSMAPGLWTRSGHFIVLWNIQDDEVFINDPASLSEERTHNSFSYLAQQCKQYFCFNQQKCEQEIEIDTEAQILNKLPLFNELLCFTDRIKDSLLTDPQ